MGLPAKERIMYVARHLAAQDNDKPPPEAPERKEKLSGEQLAELRELTQHVGRAINECDGKRGRPLRNVAESLFMIHRELSAPKRTKEEARNVARRLGMRAAAAQYEKTSYNDPPPLTPREKEDLEAERRQAEASDPIMMQARQAAKAAFAKFGEGKKELQMDHLFHVLFELGQIPGADKATQQAYLEAEFQKADVDGSGTVDYDEFVDFYTTIVQQAAAESAARDAFSKYDVGGDNVLEKVELFQVLVDLGLVTGDSKAEQDAYLEREFALADEDESGTVDYQEFIQFYMRVRRQLWSADVTHRKRVQQARRDQRKARSGHYLDAQTAIDVVREGHIRLLSARWLLARAGFERTEFRKTGKWVHKRDPTPLPCRQILEQQSADAYMEPEELSKALSAFEDTVSASKGAERDGLGACPIVVVSHCWYSPVAADANGSTLMKVAEELGRQMPLYESWGMRDVGVFFDWCSVYQESLEASRSAEQEASFVKAIGQMPVLYAHKQTATYIVTKASIEPPRAARGWPYYEECLIRLFKEVPHPKRYKLPEYGPTQMWTKVIRMGDEDVGATFRGQGPPVAPSRFIAAMGSKILSREADRTHLLADYRKTIESGFVGLSSLSYSRRGWGDGEMAEFAATISEVECINLKELDLSSNDFTAEGLEMLGAAFKSGALHNLETLSLSDCAGLRALPEGIADLNRLSTLRLDGCIGITELPASFARMASLKTLDVTHCLKLLSNAKALKLLPATVTVVKEKVVKASRKAKSAAPA